MRERRTASFPKAQTGRTHPVLDFVRVPANRHHVVDDTSSIESSLEFFTHEAAPLKAQTLATKGKSASLVVESVSIRFLKLVPTSRTRERWAPLRVFASTFLMGTSHASTQVQSRSCSLGRGNIDGSFSIKRRAWRTRSETALLCLAYVQGVELWQMTGRRLLGAFSISSTLTSRVVLAGSRPGAKVQSVPASRLHLIRSASLIIAGRVRDQGNPRILWKMHLDASNSSEAASESKVNPERLYDTGESSRDHRYAPGPASTRPEKNDEHSIMPVLFLLDALSLVYRSFYALQNRPLFSSSGINTSAIYGFIQTIMSLLQRYNPESMAVVFDSRSTEPGPGSFRQTLFPKYKANRERMPDGVRDALPFVSRMLRFLGIQSFELDSYEADDVIGTLANEANRVGYQVVIVSSDKDFRQLLKPNWIRLLRPARSSTSGGFEEYAVEDLVAECGAAIQPSQYADVLALAGDSVDNIPGVPGVGIKTAARLISQLQSIEFLFSHLDAVQPERLRERIITNADIILRNKLLVKIQTNIPLNVLRPSLDDPPDTEVVQRSGGNEPINDWISCCRRRAWNTKEVVALLRELDMDGLSRRIQYLARFHAQGRTEKRFNEHRDAIHRQEMASTTTSMTLSNTSRAMPTRVSDPEPSATCAEIQTTEAPLNSKANGVYPTASSSKPYAAAAATAEEPLASAVTAAGMNSDQSADDQCSKAAHLSPSDLSTDALAVLAGFSLQYQVIEASALDAFLTACANPKSMGLSIVGQIAAAESRSRRSKKKAMLKDQETGDDVMQIPNMSLPFQPSSGAEARPSCLGIALDRGVAAGLSLPASLTEPTCWMKTFRECLSIRQYPIVGFDLKGIWKTLAIRMGIDGAGLWIDPAVADALLQPDESFERPDLLAKRYLGALGAALWAQYVDVLNVSISSEQSVEARALAAAVRADLARSILDIQIPRLDALGMRRLAFEVEFPLTKVLADMERFGVYVDRMQLHKLAKEMEQELRDIESQIFAIAGKSFNIRSADQLARVLFEELGAPVPARTPAGKPSTSDRVLEALARLSVTSEPHEPPSVNESQSVSSHDESNRLPLDKAAHIAELAQEHRQVSKLLSTYVHGLEKHISPETQRIHATFHQTGAITGRLSSSSPNLQSIPIRSTRGRALRAVFRATPVPSETDTSADDQDRGVLISADYEQIELRIIAALSADTVLVQAFRDEVDVHAQTAARLFGQAHVSSIQRSYAKAINYGIPYGVSAFGLSQNLRISMADARQLIRDYHQAFPGIAQLRKELIEKARAVGYASTLLGRRRYLPALRSRNYTERAAAERAAVNMPIQGSQADMIKVAMVRIWTRLRSMSLRTRLVIQVHDELVFEAPASEVDLVLPLIQEEMERALPLPNDIPVKVRLGYGDSWMTAHAA
jgi:DNA polymerase-1